MKKLILLSLVALMAIVTATAQEKQAKIKFETTSIDLGTFSTSDCVQKCTFKFTNAGDAPLIIHQAVASCGCTVPTYTKKPIKPGESGEIRVVYNGAGKFPGKFKKTITVRSNGDPEMTRLYITGVMEATDANTQASPKK